MSKKEEILKEAESRVRLGGYNNVSFRDLAAAVGIKSASVHYHFPTKADLGAELVERYTQRFLDKLGTAQTILAQGNDPIAVYVDMFRNALIQDKKMCLCGLLGAEADGLPDKVRIGTKRFFELNLDWLERAYQARSDCSVQQAQALAAKALSQLEGALLISRTLDKPALFESVVADLSA